MQDVFASHWRLRFMSSSPLSIADGAELLKSLAALGLDVTRFSTLYNYDDKTGYTLEQSE